MNNASEFVYIRTYSRWIDELGRRETWPETVERYINFIKEERGDKIPEKVLRKIKEKILSFEVMPSMRALWAAGEAARADNTCMYNCSFAKIDKPDSFAEALYILMCGTGDGYSVQKEWVNWLPTIPAFSGSFALPLQYEVEDSRAGWANSVKFLLNQLYLGQDVFFDYTKCRPKGARLKTMGGRSSGPDPLITLHSFIKDVFIKAQGRKLTTLECSDIRNQIADTVVVGGVRRSSQIAFSDLNDEEMRGAKNYPFHPRRSMANHSAVYDKKPTAVEFLKEWSALASSGTGERGICNLVTARNNSPKRRNKSLILGANPCFEILLRDKQFCNLSEVVVRANDDLDDLMEKVETATWIGVIQSTFTYFPYLSPEWQKNCEEERLLGVSLTGQLDNPDILTSDTLKALKKKAIKIAKHASSIMGVNMPAAVTCVKPSGTVSQLVDSASGLHPRYAPYYIRRYRISANDALYKMLKDQKLKMVPENGQETFDEKDVTTWIVSFPVKSPENAIVREQMNAIEQLEWYKKLQVNWCEHNASATIYVKDEEWFEVGNWVYKNWDVVNGVSFLPYDGGKYNNAPYEEITEQEYNKLLKEMPKIDYSQLSKYEKEDNTQSQGVYACSGDKCEIV